MSTRIVLKNVRLSYANLLEAKPAPDGSRDIYATVCILDPATQAEQIEAIEGIIHEEAQERFGSGKVDVAKLLSNGKLHNPLKKGDDDSPDTAGMMTINASSEKPPGVVDRSLRPITDPELIYSGCYANVSINLFPFDVKTKKGIGVGLNNVQFVKDGERLDGRVSAEREFEELEPLDMEEEEKTEPKRTRRTPAKEEEKTTPKRTRRTKAKESSSAAEELAAKEIEVRGKLKELDAELAADEYEYEEDYEAALEAQGKLKTELEAILVDIEKAGVVEEKAPEAPADYPAPARRRRRSAQ